MARLVSRAGRRGFAGDPVWLAVAVAAWLVQRSRRTQPVVWRGRLAPGQRLVITSRDGRTGSDDGAD